MTHLPSIPVGCVEGHEVRDDTERTHTDVRRCQVGEEEVGDVAHALMLDDDEYHQSVPWKHTKLNKTIS